MPANADVAAIVAIDANANNFFMINPFADDNRNINQTSI